ncbi:carbohydrate porin [Sphingobium sp.]|uniref:carbohydrate porin n=1 Tax=Sphingobium sp. TaxID=1912891 RepID=UPI0035C6D5E1
MTYRFLACALAAAPCAPIAPATAQVVTALPDVGQSQRRTSDEVLPVVAATTGTANYPKPQVQFPRPAMPEDKTLTGPLAPLGRTLSDRGIYLRFLAVDEFAASVSGGQERGIGNSYALPFGTDLDLDRMIGLKGAFIHISMNVSKGSSLSADHAGNAISFQTRYKAFQNLRLAALAIEQNLFDGKLNLSGGRVSPLTYFNQSNIYCTFQNNSVCFNPAVVPIQDRALGFFPYGTWGGRIKLAPAKGFYVQAGLFEANPSLNPTNGFNWSTRGSTGHQAAVEFGFQSSSSRARNPWHIRIGGYHNTSDVADPYLNTDHRPRIAAGGKPLLHEGQAGWYVMGDAVAAHLHGDVKRPVTIFGGFIGSTANYVPFRSQTIAGVILTGPLAGRPRDTLGLVGSYIRIGDRQVDYLQASRAAAGGTDRVRNGEGIFELNYGIAAGRNVRISPNLQYVINPDNFLLPRARRQSKDIMTFGLRISVDIAGLLGMPAMK